ncbi:MAG: glutathione S-transferase N-terminal domain-containing protein [Rhodanobacteraceae bacterium]
MIELFFAPTPNGLKARLMLEECEVPYRVVPVNLGKGEQFRPEYLAISPNNKIPAIVDDAPAGGGAPLAIFESGAILMYLAEKTGRFLPSGSRDRMQVLQWLFWQVSGLGPMAGQIGHFKVFAPEPVPYALDRYTRELARLYRVLDRKLAGNEFIAGDFSLADIACYPWIVPHRPHGQHLADFPNLQRWFDAIAERPATRATYDGVTDVYSKTTPLSDEARRALFGHSAANGAT